MSTGWVWHERYMWHDTGSGAGARAEPGCPYYALHASDDDPDLLLMYEVFASSESFSEHMRSAHVHDFLAASAELTLEPLAVLA